MAENYPTTVFVPLTKGYVAIIDYTESESINRYKWSASVAKRRSTQGPLRVYAVRMERGRGMVTMHGQILGAFNGDIDHQDGNTLNNCRANLRRATRTQNNANSRKRIGTSSKYKGVFFHRQTEKWCAQICVEGHKKHLGIFREEFDAATAYNFAAVDAFGEFARLNTI